jgi:L-malate glycosyltransferase
MKILICGPFEPNQIFRADAENVLPIGLGGVPVNLLVRELASAGHLVTVIGTSKSIEKIWVSQQDNLTAYLVPSRTRVRTLGLTQFSKEIREMKRIIRTLDFDILHAHWTYEFALACLGISRSTLVTAHDAPLTILKWFKDPYRLIRLIMAWRVRLKANHLTCVSPYLAEKWTHEMLWRKQISVVPNISPFEPTYHKHQKEIGLNIITIGDSSVRKNLKALILAMPEIRRSIPNSKLDIFGNGLHEGGELEKWAREHNLGSGITWHGFQDRPIVREALVNADLLIHPSLEEAQPMVPLEAMSCGVPVIAGIGAGGTPWTLGAAGLLVDMKNPQAIANSVINTLNDAKIRMEMSELGANAIRTRFSPKIVSSLYLEQYQEIQRNTVRNKK